MENQKYNVEMETQDALRLGTLMALRRPPRLAFNFAHDYCFMIHNERPLLSCAEAT